MPFAIVAELPLGTYRGGGQDGRPERLPSVVRLHSALLCAAGFGPRAVPLGGDTLDVCEADKIALRWLEENPPDSVRIPALQVNTVRAVAYRSDGTIKKSKSAKTIKTLAKSPAGGTAVGGQFAWIWREPPPQAVRAAIEQLCPDVAYLGTSESPVRLSAAAGDDVEPTHDLDAEAGMFTVGVTPVQRPVAGRTGELAAAHREATWTPPSAAKDKPGTDEKSLSPVPSRRAVETARYLARRRSSPDIPWAQAIVVPLNARVEERHRVRWAVVAHRALIKLIGYGAPPVVTGAYPPGASRPANRVALHLLGPGMPCAAEACSDPARRELASLAILVPCGTGSSDLDVLHRAVEGLTSLRGPGGKIASIGRREVQVLDGSDFWLPPEPGHVRLWRTVPAAVPDTRGGSEWTFAHAALLSLGFTWKDCLPEVPGRREEYHRGLATVVSDRGAAVVHVKAVRTSDVGQYAHKVNEHAVVRPYTAVLHLGDLAGPCTVQAIGQSRHLGGGLLVPFDVAEGTPAGGVSLPGADLARDGW